MNKTETPTEKLWRCRAKELSDRYKKLKADNTEFKNTCNIYVTELKDTQEYLLDILRADVMCVFFLFYRLCILVRNFSRHSLGYFYSCDAFVCICVALYNKYSIITLN